MTRRPRLPTPGWASAAFFMVLVAGTAWPVAGCTSGMAPAAADPPAASTPLRPDAPPPADRPRVIGPGSSRQPPVEGAPPTPTAAAHAEALSRVESMIGEPRCASDTQCHTVAIGARACGGPVSYRAWSDAITDGEALRQASGRERQLAVQAEREAGRMSPCLFLADPGARCVQGVCQTRVVPAPSPALPSR